VELSADIGARVDSFALDVSLEANGGEVLAILGPNGAGKTTLLRCLAGLQPIDTGHITLGDVVLDEPERDYFVPVEAREVGVSFQDYLLFARLSVLENVAFGLRARGCAKHDARQRAMAWLERFAVAEHASARPRQLSGGQQQRVALARALVTEPKLLLLDEPLAALDASTRATVRRDLRRHLSDFSGVCLVVTHDPVDAYAIADRVLVLENGRATQCGTLSDVAAHPRSRYVAQLVGTNLLRGAIDGATLTTATGATLTVEGTTEGDAYASIAPQAIALYRERPVGSPRNVWQSVIVDTDRSFDRVRVTFDDPLPLTAEITAGGFASLEIQQGDPVWISVKATEINTYLA
jgi:molybdate transport system ATP-binding protein